jgi:hypothetical protein
MQKMYLSTTFFAMCLLSVSIAPRLAKEPQSQNPKVLRRFWLANRPIDPLARQMPKDGRGQRDLPSGSSQSVVAAFVFQKPKGICMGHLSILASPEYAHKATPAAQVTLESCSSLEALDIARLNKPLRHRWLYGFPWAALLGLFLTLLLVMSWRYVGFTTKQLQVKPAKNITWNSDLLYKNLQGAVQIQTVSQPLSKLTEDSPLHRFRDFVEETFPALHRSPFIRRTGLDFENALIPSLLFEWPGQNPSLPGILLMSHFDVVPIEKGTHSKWTHEPFSGHIDGTYLWGRGTLDCKHGVMAILEAIDRHAADGFQPERTIYIALGHDEELGGQEGNAKMAEWLRSQGRKLQMVLDEGGCIFTEFPGLNQPAALVGVAEKGC